MSLWRKQTANPIDRAVEELERQIAALQRQARAIESQPASPVASTAETMTKFVKEMLTPPPKKPPATDRPRRDLFDGAAEPMKELGAEPVATAAQPEPDLFVTPKKAESARRRGDGATIDCAPKPEEKLGLYISAGSLKGFKRPLRVEQRRNRNRFFMWLGLACVALWFIWAVIR
jgi:hypothetical protein